MSPRSGAGNPRSDPTARVLLDSLMALALAQGSAASHDCQAVISEMIQASPARPSADLALMG